jgi:pimeloyl-ACP methyl ester carboxylesterase
VIAIGHSSGGHLALWLAARPKLTPADTLYQEHPLAIHAVVSLAGITDLARAKAEGICADAAEQLVGAGPEVFPRRYAQASAEQLLPLGVPQVLVQGSRDHIVPPSHVAPYIRKAQELGDRIWLVELDGARHADLLLSQQQYWQEIKAIVLQLVEP